MNRRFGIMAAAVCSFLAIGGGVASTQAGSAQSASPVATGFTISAPASVRPGEVFAITVSGVPAGRWAAIESQGGTLGWPQANAQGIATLRTQTWLEPTVLTVRIDGQGLAKNFTIAVGNATTTVPPTTTTTIPSKPRVSLALFGASDDPYYNRLPFPTVEATLPDGSKRNLAQSDYVLQTVDVAPYVRRVTVSLVPTSTYQADPLVVDLKFPRPNVEQIPTTPGSPPKVKVSFTDPVTNQPTAGFGRLSVSGIAVAEWFVTNVTEQVIDLNGPWQLSGNVALDFVSVGFSNPSGYAQGWLTPFTINVSGLQLRAVQPPTSVQVGKPFTLNFAGAPAGTWVAVTYLSRSSSGLGNLITLGWAPVASDGTASITSSLWETGNLLLRLNINGQGQAVELPLTVTG
jgi:predicted RecA/RadA family phage recombinase